MSNTNKSSYALCKLDNHAVVPYHAACQVGRRPYNHHFQYIGDGIVFAVAGIRQLGNYDPVRLSFFKLKARKKYVGKRW